jgi:translation initiation factor RLI1
MSNSVSKPGVFRDVPLLIQSPSRLFSRVIRSLLDSSNFVIVVEHDLSVIDYLSDFICVLYGVPGA